MVRRLLVAEGQKIVWTDMGDNTVDDASAPFSTFVAKALRDKRRSLNLSQSKVASELSKMGKVVDQSYVSRTERSKSITVNSLVELCKVYQCSPSDIIKMAELAKHHAAIAELAIREHMEKGEG